MGYLDTYINKLEKFKNELEPIAKDVVRRNEKTIVETFQEEQIGKGLKVGIRKDLIKIKRKDSTYTGYAPSTQDIWKESNSYTDKFDKSAGNNYYMQWTGEFFGLMEAYYVSKYSFAVISHDTKLDELLKWYGSNLLDIGRPTMKIMEEKVINPVVEKELMKRINALV